MSGRLMMERATPGLSKGGVGCFRTWTSGLTGQPVMVLYAANGKPGRGFAVQWSRIGLYVDEKTGSGTVRLPVVAREIALHLGMDPIDATVNNIADVIVANAEDLMKMNTAAVKPS